MRSAIALIVCVAVLALVDISIVRKERQLATGTVVYLELAPVDPRSFMQGDYMALRFKIANDALAVLPRKTGTIASGFWRTNLAPGDGRIVALVDGRSVASYRRVDDGTPLGANEVLLRYRVREGQLKFATNAFFFEEGTAKRYESARYGEFRVAPDGDLLLTGLRGQDLQSW
jgi:uncharacterized membrane-anchored protein